MPGPTNEKSSQSAIACENGHPVSSTRITLADWRWPRHRPLALTRPPALVFIGAALLALLLLAAEARDLTGRAAAPLRAESRAAGLLLDGFHKPERDARGSYRWSSGDSRI